MFNMIWPVLLVLLSNIFYNICQKQIPGDINPFFALMITYLIAAVVTFIVFLFTSGVGSLPTEIKKINWVPFVLGVAVVGLELGYVYLYRNGWKISTGSIVCNICLAIALVFVGLLLYKEKIEIKQIIGMILCSGGLVLITK